MTKLSKEAIEFLTTPRLMDASNPKVAGSYTKENKFVPDNDQIIADEPSNVQLHNNMIVTCLESDEYIEKVEKVWSAYKKTEKGANAFSGPIIVVDDYHVNVQADNEIILNLGLKSYADFVSSYAPEFTSDEKRRTYSFGTNSIVKSVDGSLIFGIRSGKLSSAGGIYEPVGGFLDLTKLVDEDVNAEIRKSMKEETFWYDVKHENIPIDIDVERAFENAFNLEKCQELGISEKNISDVANIAFTRKDLYQNFNLYMLVETDLEAGEILEKNKRKGDGELKAFAVPMKDMDSFILENKQLITPTLKAILMCSYT